MQQILLVRVTIDFLALKTDAYKNRQKKQYARTMCEKIGR